MGNPCEPETKTTCMQRNVPPQQHKIHKTQGQISCEEKNEWGLKTQTLQGERAATGKEAERKVATTKTTQRGQGRVEFGRSGIYRPELPNS